MRIGGSGSTHHAGMSALWHDPDFEPIRQFEPPLVQKNFDDLPVPTEKHELPDGVDDPFKKLDAVYDAAAVQMERGLKGAEFLHGKKPPPVGDPSGMAGPDDPTRIRDRPTDPARQQVTTLDRQTRDHQRRLDQAANTPTVKSSSSTKTAADKEVEHAANAGAATDGTNAIDALMTFGPMVAAQAATATVQGPLATASTAALQTVNTVTAASEVALAGISEGQSDVVDTPPSGPRRGLSRKG